MAHHPSVQNSHESPVCLAVLNPKGRDPYLDYANGPGRYQAGVHAPINFHAFAAATFGAFYNSTEDILASQNRYDAVLVLIRRRTWISLAAVKQLKEAGMRVIVAWKECGDHQIEKQLKKCRARRAYGEILSLSDGIVSPTSTLPLRLGQISEEDFLSKAALLPTPYPLEYADWDFSIFEGERNGIMVGTREFGTEERNHREAIQRLGRLAENIAATRITVINSEKKPGLDTLNLLSEAFPDGVLQIEPQPLPYPEYMRLLASHRLLYQMDFSNVPGQVAGDCLLARTLCAGGNSAIEQLAFPDLSDDGSRSETEVFSKLQSLLHDEETYKTALVQAQQLATEKLSFQAISRQLGDWDILK